MPKGPRGEKRPADAIGRAVHIARIATGEIEDEREAAASAAAQLGSLGGKKRAGQHDVGAPRGDRAGRQLSGGRRINPCSRIS